MSNCSGCIDQRIAAAFTQWENISLIKRNAGERQATRAASPQRDVQRHKLPPVLQRLTRIPRLQNHRPDWRPGNSTLEKRYTSFGFQKTGQRTSEGDIVATLRLNGTAEQVHQSDESA